MAVAPQPSSIPSRLLGIHHDDTEGFHPLVDFGAWRVALLNYSPSLAVKRLDAMQRHDETDEVFVLLQGRCLLFIGDGDQQLSNIQVQELHPGYLYNVRQGVWHTHSLSPDAKVLVVENRATTYDNSPFISLSPAQQQSLRQLAKTCWPLL